MIIALSGTPGVGKTECARILRNRDLSVIDLNELVISNNFISGRDEERKSDIIDIEALDGFINKEYHGADVTLEGHLSHLLSVDMAVILRCNPLVLRERLATRDWNDSKIMENMQAEILDVIKIEAHDHLERVFEIDTTSKAPQEVVDLYEAVISGKSPGDDVGWLEEFEYILFE
jgi:adenylate kinase